MIVHDLKNEIRAGALFQPSHILHENVPYGYDVANGAGQYKEMEHAVHVAALVEAVEQGSCDVEHALGHNPRHGGRAYVVYQRLEGHEHAEAHADVAHRLYVAVLLSRLKLMTVPASAHAHIKMKRPQPHIPSCRRAMSVSGE